MLFMKLVGHYRNQNFLKDEDIKLYDYYHYLFVENATEAV